MMLAAGVPLAEIGKFVGHSGASMTDQYAHLLDGQTQAAAEWLDRYLTSPPLPRVTVTGMVNPESTCFPS